MLVCAQSSRKAVAFATVCSWIGAALLTVFGAMCMLAVITEIFPSIIAVAL